MKTKLKDTVLKILDENYKNDRSELIKRIEELGSNDLKPIEESLSSAHLADLLEVNAARLIQGKNDGEFIATGFKDFDKEFGGFFPGEFVVIGGRPAMGKTLLLISLALNISKTHNVLYFSFDHDEVMLSQKFLSALTNIPLEKLLSGILNDEELKTIKERKRQFESLNIHVNTKGRETIQAFKDIVERHIEKHSDAVVILDYLQMMNASRKWRAHESEFSLIVRELKQIAKEKKLVLIASSQLSRAVETRGGDKKPMMSDLRESGSIEQDTDKVLFLYRPEYYQIEVDENGDSTEGYAELMLVKNKNGKTGEVSLAYDSSMTRFKDYQPGKNLFEIPQKRWDELDD